MSTPADRESMHLATVTAWTSLAVLVVSMLGYGLVVAGVIELGGADVDVSADLARAAQLLGLGRDGQMVGDLGTDPWSMEEAGGLVDRAVALAPRSADAHRLRALHRLMAGSLDTALDAAAHAVALAPQEPANHLVLGAVQTQARDFEAAESTFRTITETWPSSVEGWHGLGQVLFLLGREEESVAAYREKLAVKKRRGAATATATPAPDAP